MKSGLSIVIPCFNEEEGVPQLREKLLPLLEECRKTRAVEVIFVNDGSTDRTLERLQQSFAGQEGVRLLSHAKNQNLGAALRTGWAGAKEELVAFLDADCTYEPAVLLELLPALDAGADLALASPYHPRGAVAGVPAWRLFLSRTLSRIYRAITRSDLHTFTGMVRVFRRSSFTLFTRQESDFTFVALMTLWAALQGLKISEQPATLHLRTTGVSKMRTLRVMRGHLHILADLLLGRGI